jgi:hypothetical protein
MEYCGEPKHSIALVQFRSDSFFGPGDAVQRPKMTPRDDVRPAIAGGDIGASHEAPN